MKTAWCVDDDQEMVEAVKLMLRLLEYETRSFYNARNAAKALLAGERPDLIILDINMPQVSGMDMLEFIRRRPEWERLPVVMLSSEATDVQVDEAMQRGADAYVFKPVSLDDLEVAINSALEKRRA
jgi:two-component system alkaline phosphatase synthesis response regulator PhoP